MQRYFVKFSAICGNQIQIDGSDYHHITKVMRMKKGDQVYVASENKSWLCHIESIDENIVYLEIDQALDEKKELPLEVTIAQGIVRREKMEEVIEKITALGASSYIPIEMERCNVKLYDEKIEKKWERMNKIAKEAAEQSHRTKLLDINRPISFHTLLTTVSHYDLCLYAYELTEKGKSLKEILQKGQYQRILVLIGPEGGISEKEAYQLDKNNFSPIHLGPRILRTELAPVYVLSAISYELEG
ncbi:MAG: 16S rRNA (uracil(1498)-N(3))-methyltransferase [Prevotella sp.]|nr:16S rRNA (uracil(1498)-N(3))-methyltransferase [Staphylococcus sp.]MCM1349959.1 16S rRNA (uracil(1498)-N(3))-methyltransferase [Prevotella sp.]